MIADGVYWDDGNTNDLDGCSSTCGTEAGWVCTGGSATSPDTCVDICGDGIVMTPNPAYCDDGNTSDGDGCSSSCGIEVGWECTLGTNLTSSVCKEIWGDGIVIIDTPTNWDDGNLFDRDGCSGICLVEEGWTCTGGSPTNPDMCFTTWGDGILVQSIEIWDDGNSLNGDGWSSACQVEFGYKWTFLAINNPDSVCTPVWGDGFKLPVESWDDGNTNSGDGCNSLWVVETGWTWTGGSTSSSDTCKEIWGDGRRVYSGQPDTYCDDGNIINNDGWSSSCGIEQGWSWSGGTSTSPDSCNLCAVANCTSCTYNDHKVWVKWEEGFNLTDKNSTWVKPPEVSEAVEDATTATQVITGVGVALTAGISLLSLSSPTAIWAMANQLQLFMLLLLTRRYLPVDVIAFITGQKFFSFCFDFIPIDKLDVIKIPAKWMHKEQTNDRLMEIGVESGSVFSNNCYFCAYVLALVVIQIILSFFKGCKLKEPSSKLKRLTYFVYHKVWDFFSFNIYLRSMIEGYQFLLISWIYELKEYDVGKFAHQFSYSLASVTFIILVGFMCLALHQFRYYTSHYNPNKHTYWDEFFIGVKNQKYARAYYALFLTRKLVYVSWLMFFDFIPVWITVIVFAVMQICYFLLIALLRPFENGQDNFIEVINELYFAVLVTWLVPFDRESEWIGSPTKIYVGIMMSNNCLISIVLFCKQLLLTYIFSLILSECL